MISAIYCQREFNLINNVTFCWMTCGLQCSNLRLSEELNGKQGDKCIRMGLNIFKMFIWRGISSDMVGNHALGLSSPIFSWISNKISIRVTALKLGRNSINL